MRHIQPVVALGFYMLILLLAHFGFLHFFFYKSKCSVCFSDNVVNVIVPI